MKKQLCLFNIGAFGYCGIEILARGYTHWTMGITGGICLMLLWAIYSKVNDIGIIGKSVIGAIAITAIELCVGLVVNVWLKMGVWSYIDEPFNILGQICPVYTFYWFCLSLGIMSVLEILHLAHMRKAK
ncbi:MAG: hypothetical protein RR508_00455 [Oscillospiraceae bacterium]